MLLTVRSCYLTDPEQPSGEDPNSPEAFSPTASAYFRQILGGYLKRSPTVESREGAGYSDYAYAAY